MRVLCAYYNYPQLSATYVEAELQFLRRHGIEVEVWSETDPGSTYPSAFTVHRGTFQEAEASFRPDIVHFYWLKMLKNYIDVLECPHITVRSHSFETESIDAIELAADRRVKAIFLFPHQAAEVGATEKIVPLPVAYDSIKFPLRDRFQKQRNLVACCTAGLPRKTLEVFFEVAARCPELSFELAVATCAGHERIIDDCRRMNEALAKPAKFHVDLAHSAVPPLLQRASVYLCTQGSAKRGMPIAVAEALASGCQVLVPNLPWLREMVGSSGVAYSSADDAAAILRGFNAWSDSTWLSTAIVSAQRGASEYSDDRVLPRLVATWAAILA